MIFDIDLIFVFKLYMFKVIKRNLKKFNVNWKIYFQNYYLKEKKNLNSLYYVMKKLN